MNIVKIEVKDIDGRWVDITQDIGSITELYQLPDVEITLYPKDTIQKED